jgi:xenotropic and polytropic retrovirus receptor 1
MSLSFYRINKATHNQVLFILFACVNSTYCFIWDIAMDWSLCNPHAPHPFLRDILVFRPVWVYYAAMCLDATIRFNWIFFAIFVNDIQHSAVLSFLIAFSEICRRGMWTVFRVENEHCANVHMFRALRDVPLPYDIPLHVHDPTPGNEISPNDGQLQPHERPTVAAGPDIEYGTGQEGSPATISRSPASRKMSRVGTLMATAHSQDFQRKKRLDPVSGGEPESQSAEDTTDEDEESPSHCHGAILDAEFPSPAVYRTLSG